MKVWVYGMVVLLFGCGSNDNSQGVYADFGGFRGPAQEGAVPGVAGAESFRTERVEGTETPSDGDLLEEQSIPDDSGTGENVPVDSVVSSNDSFGVEDGDAGEGEIGVSSGGELGAGCTEELPCEEGLVCEPWPAPNGVCTVLDCQDTGCPANSQCIQFDATRWGCMPSCSSSGDCREGDACKTLWKSGSYTSVCHAIGANPVKEAGLCIFNSDCQGKMSCMRDFSGGYCAQLDCSPAKPCPIGTGCYALPDFNACMKICDPSKPCPGGLVGVQVCEAAELLTGTTEDICLEGEVQQEVGEFCKEGEECASGNCQLTSIGYCENGLGPCLTEKDCGQDPCIPSDEFTFGSCVEECAYGEACPEGTVCVPLGTGSGECVKDCKGLSDVVTCGSSASCEYGFPFGPIEEGQGVYACRPKGGGLLGDPCTNTGECSDALSCFQVPGGGVCAEGCGGLLPNGLNYCGWGGACVSAQNSSQCLPLCPKGNVQCEDGFSCQTKFVGVPFPLDVCLPE